MEERGGRIPGHCVFRLPRPVRKVQNCPIKGTNLRLTCYATGYADSAFSIPACTRYKGKHIGGFFTHDDDGNVEFVPLRKYDERLPMRPTRSS